MKNKSITAAELMAQLNADPEFVAKRARAEAEHQARVDDLRRALTPLLEDLQRSGIAVQSTSELLSAPYPDTAPVPRAIPILLEHLSKDYPDDARELIARALAVPEARIGWRRLVDEFHRAPEGRGKDGLAAALAATVDDSLWPELLELIRDRRNGPSRVLLLSAVESWDDDRADPVLAEFEDDPVLHLEVAAMRRRRAQRKKQRERRRKNRMH